MVHFAKLNQVLPSTQCCSILSSNIEGCAKNLSQILANNIDNLGRELVSKFARGIAVGGRKVTVPEVREALYDWFIDVRVA